ncbi:MAG: carbamoyltransferase C-terminal domain-containing protein, partial [Acidobacteriota bacterium]
FHDDHRHHHQLIEAFEPSTGYGVIINTSFNVRGERIVCTPQETYPCFIRTEMDALLLEELVLYRHEQLAPDGGRNWRREYQLD